VARATTDRGIRRSAIGGHDAADTGSAAITRPSCGPPAEAGATLTDRVFSALRPAEPKSDTLSERIHAVRWEIGSSSGPFSPREFVAPTRGFMPSGARCSPGFSISSGLSPSSSWFGATTDLLSQAWHGGPAPLRERFPSTDTTGASVGCLSECHRTMKLAGLSRDRRTLMRFRTSSSYRAVQRPGVPGS
jgi:hypothetical protein